MNYSEAIIQYEGEEPFYSHQRLVVIHLLNKNIDVNFTEEELDEAIDEVDMIKDLNIKMEEDITLEDIFFELS